MKSALKEARSDQYPKIPSTLLSLGLLLHRPNMRPICRTVDGTDTIYQGVIGSTLDRTVALVFVSGRMLQFLEVAKELHCDGTFRKRSRKPSMAQIWNIVTKYLNNVSLFVSVCAVSYMITCLNICCPRLAKSSVI